MERTAPREQPGLEDLDGYRPNSSYSLPPLTSVRLDTVAPRAMARPAKIEPSAQSHLIMSERSSLVQIKE